MYAKIQNGSVVYPPRNDGNRFNVDTCVQWLQQHGFTDMTAQQIAPYLTHETVDYTAFDNACQMFRQVCYQIGGVIGNAQFKGGFDQYASFIDSQYAQQNPAQAALYAAMWSGANEYAKYEGSKIGLGQPDWWYKCWNIQRSAE